MVVFRLVESAKLTDGSNPAVHLFFCLCHQVEGPFGRFNVEHKTVLELFSLKSESCVDLLAAVKINDANGLLGVVILVVLQDIWISTHAPTA